MKISKNSNVFIVLFFFLAYSSPQVFGIPSTFFFLLGAPLILINSDVVKKNELFFISGMLIVSVTSIVFSPDIRTSALIEQFKGLAQLILSILLGIIYFKWISSKTEISYLKTVKVLYFILLIGSVLEIIGIIRPISDLYRGFLFPNIYNADLRDLIYTGHIRPKFFTSEPSYLSIGLFVLSTSWVMMERSRNTYLINMLGYIFMFWATASPIVILGIMYLNYFYFHKLRVFFIVSSILTMVFLGTLLTSISNTSIPQLAAIYTRVNQAQQGKEGSFNDRFLFPLITTNDVLQNYPYFGLGITNKDAVKPISSFSLNTVVGNKTITVNNLIGNNGLFAFVIYFGILGTFLLLLVVHLYFRSLNIGEYLTLYLALIMTCFMMSGIVTPRFWVFLFTILCSYVHYYNKRKAEELAIEN